MFPTSTLLVSVLLALSVCASPITIRDDPSINIPFVANLNLTGTSLPELDRTLAAHLVQRSKQMDRINVDDPNSTLDLELKRRAASFSVVNTATLLIDTGSSNTWVGANKVYSKTGSSKDTVKIMSLLATALEILWAKSGGLFPSYPNFIFIASLVLDTDTGALSSSLVIDQQSISVASSSSGFQNIDGILGIRPTYLTAKITTEVIGISYNPTTSTSNTNGEVTFGGVDDSKYIGSITYASIMKTSPAKYYWGLDQSVTYGSSGSNVLSSTAGILVTGTTLVLPATDAFNRYKELTGANHDGATGFLTISNDQYRKLESLFFNVGNAKFELTANAQIWPRSLNTYIGGSAGNIYLIVSDLGTHSGKGLDFITGYTFLERLYTVYDMSNKRVGLANTANTKATTN